MNVRNAETARLVERKYFVSICLAGGSSPMHQELERKPSTVTSDAEKQGKVMNDELVNELDKVRNEEDSGPEQSPNTEVAEDDGHQSSQPPVVGEVHKRTVAWSRSDGERASRRRDRVRQRQRGSRYINGQRIKQNRTKSLTPSWSSSPLRSRPRGQKHRGRNKDKSSAYWSGPWSSEYFINGDQSDAAFASSSSSSNATGASNPPAASGSSSKGNAKTVMFGMPVAKTQKLGANESPTERRPLVNHDAMANSVGDASGGGGESHRKVGGGSLENIERQENDGRLATGSAAAAAGEMNASENRTCDKMKCQRAGGQCTAVGTMSARCRCPLGTRGQHCEQGSYTLLVFIPFAHWFVSVCLSVSQSKRLSVFPTALDISDFFSIG